MDTGSNQDGTGMPSTSDVLSVICFVFTAYCILKLFQPSQYAPTPDPSPRQPHVGTQEILRASDVGSDGQVENAETERESPEQDKCGMRRNEWEGSFGVEDGRTSIISLCESEESGAGGLAEEEEEEDEGEREHEDGDGYEAENEEKGQQEEDEEEEEEEEAKIRSSKERGRTYAAYKAPTNPARPKKQRVIKARRKPNAALRIYNDDHYTRYDPVIQNHGIAVLDPFRSYRQYDGYALYINPHLKETELDHIPDFGVRVDDLTASKVLRHFNRKTLHARWPAEFDRKGMIRATRVPLGRAAKRWAFDGERDVEGRWVEEEGWYYLSWGGIHTLMGKEGLDVDRYWVRPSFEDFKCRGLDFKRSDWAEIQMAPEDPDDPTFL